MTIRPQARRLQSRLLQAACITILGCCVVQPAAAAEPPGPSRVRSSDRSFIALIEWGTTQSATFRALRASVEASDGIVYIEPGHCGHGVRACLKTSIVFSGGNRFLRILIERRKTDSDAEFIGSIGHELQHALEALSQPSIRTGTQLYNFFRRTSSIDSNRFETTAAVNAGDAVRVELRVR